MERVIWLIIMLPLASLFTGLGIYAIRRKKPMWFWSGSTVSENEITDIPAYNRANGIMWIAFSGILWVSEVLGIFKAALAGLLIGIGCIAGIPALVITYTRICKKYGKKK